MAGQDAAPARRPTRAEGDSASPSAPGWRGFPPEGLASGALTPVERARRFEALARPPWGMSGEPCAIAEINRAARLVRFTRPPGDAPPRSRRRVLDPSVFSRRRSRLEARRGVSPREPRGRSDHARRHHGRRRARRARRGPPDALRHLPGTLPQAGAQPHARARAGSGAGRVARPLRLRRGLVRGAPLRWLRDQREPRADDRRGLPAHAAHPARHRRRLRLLPQPALGRGAHRPARPPDAGGASCSAWGRARFRPTAP